MTRMVPLLVTLAACASDPTSPDSGAPLPTDPGIDLGECALYDGNTTIAPPVTVTSDYDDAPTSSLGPVIPEVGYYVGEIRNGVYWVTEGTYQAMFVVGDAGVVVVDAPPTIGGNLLAAIASVTDLPVTHLLYSHSHADHIGAAGLFDPSVEIIAHEDTASQLARQADPNRPVPDTTFDGSTTLTLQGRTFQIVDPGNNHEPGNVIFLLPDDGVAMVVDVIFPGWMMWRRLAVAEDVPGLFVAVDALRALDFDTLVSGHVGRLGTRADVEQQREFMFDLVDAAGAALGSVPLETVAASLQPEDLGNPWAFFDGFIDRVVVSCVDELEPKWRPQLAAFDVFIYEQCLAMEQSLRIDGPPPVTR